MTLCLLVNRPKDGNQADHAENRDKTRNHGRRESCPA